MIYKYFLSIGLLLMVISIGCSSVAKVIRQPLPEIVGTTASSGSPGFDYTVWVKCTIRNSGADGSITVIAELRNGGFWRKRETVFIAANSERQVTLAFPEATFLSTGLNGYRYTCSTN